MGNLNIDKSFEYYNQNATPFVEHTLNADMSLWRDKLAELLPRGGAVLDAGCGSGRDSKAFLEQGFSVTAIDAAEEMCRVAGALIGQGVRQIRFEELDYEDCFDGIWACASLIHVKPEDLDDVMERLSRSLKLGGYIYISFKYGEGEMERPGRRFTNMTEEGAKTLLEKHRFAVVETGVTEDVRPDKSGEHWTNVIGRKT